MSRAGLALGGALAVSLAALAGCGSRGEVPSRYDVVLVSIDTLRADRLNAYGYRDRVVSPQLDALARDGLLFETHVSASPWTTPAHISLLTSLHPSAHGVTSPFGTLMQRLDSGADYDRLGEEHETLAQALRRSGRATAAFTGGLSLDPRIGFDRGFESYDVSLFKLTERNLETLGAWTRAHRAVPFFLFLHTFEVHAPYLDTTFLPQVLPQETAARVTASLADLRARIEAGGTPEVWKGGPKAERRLEREQAFSRDVCSALYDGGVRAADAWIGRFLQALKREGLYDRSLIVVTSDHGEQLGEKPGEEGGNERDGRFYNAHGHTLYDEMLRVPLIVKLPGQHRAGTRIRQLSRTIDVMPTILDVLGIEVDVRKLQGASLRLLWEGRERSEREALSESLSTPREGKSLQRGRYKYILSVDADTVAERGRSFIPERPAAAELYDLTADPEERHNLLAAPAADRLRQARLLEAELRRRVDERRGRTERTQLAPETLEGLKALGYVE
jgi:arylsulfatase A-like enzyme